MPDYTLKAYFVMTSGQLDRLERFAKGGYFRRILTSYAYKEIIDKFAEHLGPEECSKLDVFVDSDAFTVMTQGLVVDIDKYADYLKSFTSRYKFNTVYAFNLDVIPKPSEQELLLGSISHEKLEEAAEGSWNNYLYLTEKKGIDYIVPVFHYGEDMKWLRRIVESGCSYFAFGGVAGRIKSTTMKKAAFDELFTNLETYSYKGRVHMLGLCMPDVLCMHGWYSVDATITKSAGYGHIYLFDANTREKVKVVPVSPTRPGAAGVLDSARMSTELKQEDYLKSQLKVIGMGDVSIKDLGHPEGGFWLRVEACFRSWSLFEDWLTAERRRQGKFAVYDVVHQSLFDDILK